MRSHVSLRQLSARVLSAAICVPLVLPTVVSAASARTAKPAAQQAAQQGAPAEQFVDGIAAIVDKDVITLRELAQATDEARRELQAQKIQPPAEDVLRRQVLERLITERVQRHEADRMGIKVTDTQIDQAIQSIAKRNQISTDRVRQEIEKTGLSWAEYRRTLSDELRLDRMRQLAVDSNIVISDAEVDAYLQEQQRRGGGGIAALAQGGAPAGQPQAQAQAQASGPEIIALAQILVRVPEGSSSGQVATLRTRAESILNQIRGGADFASVAAASSDGPEALEGGLMGARPAEGWPTLFMDAIARVQAGGVSELVQSGAGFHILKVVDRQRAGGAPAQNAAAPQSAPAAPQAGPVGGAQMQAPSGPMNVTQTRARHILIKTSTVMSDEQARQRLEQLRQRIVQGGESIETLARQNSQDSTAPQGGDLGWLNPGETVPPFEQAMDRLQPGEISEPIQSPFGWHLIQVQERRERDVSSEFQRMQARQVLFERRAEPAMQDWLAQLRDRAFIDNRLIKQDRIRSNNE